MEEQEINQNNNMQDKNDQTTTKELVALIKELAQIQAENAKISAQIFAREGKEQIANKTNEMKDKIMEQAKIYGQKAEKVQETYNLNKETKSNILQKYKDSLAEIQEQYETRNESIMQEKSDWQNEEQATMLKEHELKQQRKEIKRSPEYAQQVKEEKELAKEIKKALDEGDLDLVTAKNEELKRLKEKNPLIKCDNEIEDIQQQRNEIQEIISQCEREMEECKDERDNSIDEATQDKDNKLMEMKKQNIFQKMTGAIMNKLNGAKRFKDNVIKKASEKIGYIKDEKLPEVKQETAGKINNFKENMTEKREQLIDKGRETKEQLMQKAETKLRETIEQSKAQNAQYKQAYAEGPEK